MVSHISRTSEQENRSAAERGRFCEWVCVRVRNPRSEIRVRCRRCLSRALELIEEPPRHPAPNHGDFCKIPCGDFRLHYLRRGLLHNVTFLGITNFKSSKSQGKHCGVFLWIRDRVCVCASAAVVVVRRPELPNGPSVCISPLHDRRPRPTVPDAAPHMSPADDDDSCSLIIGTGHLEGRRIQVAKSGDLNSGLHKSEVKKADKILAGHLEPRGSTASSTNMKIALGVCTAIGLVIFGVAR